MKLEVEIDRIDFEISVTEKTIKVLTYYICGLKTLQREEREFKTLLEALNYVDLKGQI